MAPQNAMSYVAAVTEEAPSIIIIEKPEKKHTDGERNEKMNE